SAGRRTSPRAGTSARPRATSAATTPLPSPTARRRSSASRTTSARSPARGSVTWRSASIAKPPRCSAARSRSTRTSTPPAATSPRRWAKSSRATATPDSHQAEARPAPRRLALERRQQTPEERMSLEPWGAHRRLLGQYADLVGRIRAPYREGTVVTGDAVTAEETRGQPDKGQRGARAQEVVDDDGEPSDPDDFAQARRCGVGLQVVEGQRHGDDVDA